MLIEHFRLSSVPGLEVLHGCGQAALETGLLQRSLRASYPSSCGAGDSRDPDCQRKDMGSCGNACCLLELKVKESPLQAYKTLKNGLETLTDASRAIFNRDFQAPRVEK